MTPDRMRTLNLPPDLLFFNRITFGLNAIFCDLGASANFHRRHRRYLYPEEDAPPFAADLAPLPARFLSARPDPVAAPPPPAPTPREVEVISIS